MISTTQIVPVPTYRIDLITPWAMEEMVKVAEEFAANRDDLSQRAIEWILKTATEGCQIQEEMRGAYLTERVHKLDTAILVDLIRYQRLVDPVIDREGHTWSRALYESYKAHFPFSPLSGQPFSAVEPHRLAVKLTALVQPWLPEGTLIAHEPMAAPQTMDEMMQDYIVVVNSRKAMRDRAIAALFSGAVNRLDELAMRLEERVEREVERGQIESEAQAAKVERDIAAIEAHHKGEIRQLGEIIQVNKEHLERVATRLEEEKANLQNLWAQHQGLQAQIHNLKRQLGRV